MDLLVVLLHPGFSCFYRVAKALLPVISSRFSLSFFFCWALILTGFLKLSSTGDLLNSSDPTLLKFFIILRLDCPLILRGGGNYWEFYLSWS